MQQQFAYFLVIRLGRCDPARDPAMENVHGTVTATDAPAVNRLFSLARRRQWIQNHWPTEQQCEEQWSETVLPPHLSLETMPTRNTRISTPT